MNTIETLNVATPAEREIVLTRSGSADGGLAMSETRRGRRILRRIGPVLAGFLAIAVLSHATDAALRAAGVYPPFGQPMSDGLFLLAVVYRSVFAVAGCYMAARLAPAQPMRHALALGVVGLALGTAGAVATWNRPEIGPAWYALALVALAMPCAWAGGKLRAALLA
jgi:hypothetical protein